MPGPLKPNLAKSTKTGKNHSSSGNGSDPYPAKAKEGESLQVLFISGIVVGLIVIGLWISFSAISEKVRLAHGLGQVLDIVEKGRQAAVIDHQMGTADRQDLLAILERLGQFKTTGEADGIKEVQNPWNGILVAVVAPSNLVRVETIVPAHVCQRFIGFLFDQNPDALGVKQIEVRAGSGPTWRQVYPSSTASKLQMREINASCGDIEAADVALIFALRPGS